MMERLASSTLNSPARVPARNQLRPAFFAGIWTRWTSVRKVREGETTNDLFAFLTTDELSIGVQN